MHPVSQPPPILEIEFAAKDIDTDKLEYVASGFALEGSLTRSDRELSEIFDHLKKHKDSIISIKVKSII